MFREMRRKKQILSNKENIELLEKKLPKRNGIIRVCETFSVNDVMKGLL